MFTKFNHSANISLLFGFIAFFNQENMGNLIYCKKGLVKLSTFLFFL